MQEPDDGDNIEKSENSEKSLSARDEKRRKIVKRILAGGSTVLGTYALPDKWTKPLVQSVVLPAHAGMSVVPTTTTTTTTTPLPPTTIPPSSSSPP